MNLPFLIHFFVRKVLAESFVILYQEFVEIAGAPGLDSET
jgi:hypothetical protein